MNDTIHKVLNFAKPDDYQDIMNVFKIHKGYSKNSIGKCS